MNEIIVQDEEIAVLCPKKAFTAGHVIITTVQEYNILEEVPRHVIARMFQIGNKLSSVLFEQMKCQGTNMLIQNGTGAGQINSRFSINIIPRFENDNLKLEWTPTPTDAEKIQSAFMRFEVLDANEREKKNVEQKKAALSEPKPSPVIRSSEEKKKRNYYIRSLEKVA